MSLDLGKMVSQLDSVVKLLLELEPGLKMELGSVSELAPESGLEMQSDAKPDLYSNLGLMALELNVALEVGLEVKLGLELSSAVMDKSRYSSYCLEQDIHWSSTKPIRCALHGLMGYLDNVALETQ